MQFDSAISWFEIPVQDMPRAQKFYETIFGIQMQPLTTPNFDMRMFPLKNMMQGIGGALIQAKDFYKPSATDGVLIYLNADPDVQQVLDKVETAGGKILIPKTEISKEHGFMAVIRDSEGNRIGLHNMPQG